MDAETRNEASAILSAGRAWVAEWLEEGVEGIDAEALREAHAKLAGVSVAAAQRAPAQPPPKPAADRPAVSRTAPSRPAPPADAAPAPPAEKPEPRAPETSRSAEAPLPAAPTFHSSVTLDEVRSELGECTRCGLCEGRTQIVFGDGNAHADLMFIGEGPGQNEDEQGLPFVGKAGELLTQMIEKGLGIERSSVYICNIVKCRPPNNRTPLPKEVASCKPFLDGQIDAVKPKAIVALGKPATSLLLGRDVAITRVRGNWQEYRGIPVMPTFHPAYILRQYTADNRRLVWNDLKAALERSRS